MRRAYASVWRKHFKATFGDREILDALLIGATGKGKVAALRLWEAETILALGWSEKAWIRLGIGERYRKVVAHKLSDWMKTLETEEEIKRMRARK